MSNKLVSRRELAEILKVNYLTIHQLTKERKIPFILVGFQYRYDVEEVMKSLREMTHAKTLVA